MLTCTISLCLNLRTTGSAVYALVTKIRENHHSPNQMTEYLYACLCFIVVPPFPCMMGRVCCKSSSSWHEATFIRKIFLYLWEVKPHLPCLITKWLEMCCKNECDMHDGAGGRVLEASRPPEIPQTAAVLDGAPRGMPAKEALLVHQLPDSCSPFTQLKLLNEVYTETAASLLTSLLQKCPFWRIQKLGEKSKMGQHLNSS